MPLSAALLIAHLNSLKTGRGTKVKTCVLLNEADVFIKDPFFFELSSKNYHEEAFALPDLLSDQGAMIIDYCSGEGIDVILYTLRVDCVRVQKTVNSFDEPRRNTIKHVFSLRNEANILLPVSRSIDPAIVVPYHTCVLVSSLYPRIEDFNENFSFCTEKSCFWFGYI